VALNIVALLAAAALAAHWIAGAQAWVWLGVACAASLMCYVLRGWQLSTVGLIGVLDLARAPGFLLWKLQLLARSQKSKGWERTDRERP
jgi:hypothetical protein